MKTSDNFNLNVILNLPDYQHLVVDSKGLFYPSSWWNFISSPPTDIAIQELANQFFAEICKNQEPFHSRSKELKPIRDKARQFVKVVKRLYPKSAKSDPIKQLKNFARCPEITEVVIAMASGILPQAVAEGVSGTYFLCNRRNVPWAVFKPAEQEPGQKSNPKGITHDFDIVPLGKCYQRERAAYLVDRKHFSHVPKTVVARFSRHFFGSMESSPPMKGSFQRFILGADQLCNRSHYSKIPVQELHRIDILDLRILNQDRHFGNVIVDTANRLYPIDHGFSLPEKVDSLYFQWMDLDQAKEPFDSVTLDYIERINVEDDIANIRRLIPSFSEKTLERLRFSTLFLKVGAQIGLTAWDMGNLMQRHFETSIFTPSLHTEKEINAHLRKFFSENC